VALPYSCSMQAGQVELTPSREQAYPIVGGRQEQPFEVCAAGRGARCSVRMLHRFKVDCDGETVEWLSIAAEAARAGGRAVRLWNGSLEMQLAAAAGPGAAACTHRQDTAGPSPYRSADAAPCETADRASVGLNDFVTLPKGFAPIGAVGARLILGDPAPGEAGSTHLGQHDQRVALPAERLGLRTDAPPSLQPASDGDPSRAAVEPAGHPRLLVAVGPGGGEQAPDALQAVAGGTGSDSSLGRPTSPWIVTVVSEAGPDGPATLTQPGGQAFATPSPGSPLAVSLLLAMLLAAAGWVHRERCLPHVIASLRTARSGARVVVTHARRVFGSSTPVAGTGASLDELQSAAERLSEAADIALARLVSAAPLRGVLRQELDLIRQRMSDAARSRAPADQAQARQLRQRLQAGMRELHRIIKIAEGASASLESPAARSSLPSTREEAFDVLGVNADVTMGTLKKVVDALRMSWHPDHARDEPDRLRREERTKQINVAWDVIRDHERRLGTHVASAS